MTTPVLTFARIRPALAREIEEHNQLNRCVARQPNQPVLHVATKPGEPVVIEADGSTSSADLRSFELDGVFDESSATPLVFESVAMPLVQSVLDGVNATILCYGMTGSGKTHTMLGEAGERCQGVVGLAASQLLKAAHESNARIEIEVGFVQLYGTATTDLLVDDAHAVHLRIARRHDEVLVEGQSRRPLTTEDDIDALIAEGCARRKVASQRLNSASSRSHAVLTFFVSVESSRDDDNDDSNSDDGTVALRCAKLVCVDLAGSERVKESGVSGTALKEAQAINLSLFHLIRVVQCLNERQGTHAQGVQAMLRVPYADSPLTMLLSDALGGNSKTALIATLSPSQEHASQTLGTCRFAEACRCVRNGSARVTTRRILRQRPWQGVDASAEAAKRKLANVRAQGDAARQLPWAGVQAGDASCCPGGRSNIGSISCLLYGDTATAPRGVAIALHGNPSDAEAMSWLAPALVHAGYVVVCPDMPGFGQTPALPSGRIGTRSEQACDPGGPADIVEGLLAALSARSGTLVGYDWGAGTALAMAASSKHKHLVESIVCMHPAFAKERVADELKTIRASVLIMWAEDNSFHSWPKFKPLAAKLKQRLGKGYTEYRTRRETDAEWSRSARSRVIIKFLTGVDPLPAAQQVVARPVHAALSADGTEIKSSHGVVFRSEVTDDMLHGIDQEAAACRALVEAEQANELGELLRDLAHAGGSARAAAMGRFARALPSLDDSSITPARLEALGLWSAEARSAAERLQAHVAGTPRYFVGRQLLIPGGINAIGELRSVDEPGDCAVVFVVHSGQEINLDVSWRELLLLNQRHALPTTANSAGASVLRLEDGMWADFSSPLLRAELARVALALEPVFAHDIARALDVGDEEELDCARGRAVCAMRSRLDVTSFARDGGTDRGRDRHRYAKDDVARMAAYGEGHCRTCSSCFAPFLWSFANLLAIDPHYCTDTGASHQWLQYETRPSMTAFVCDIYRDELTYQRTGQRGCLLCEPVTIAYAAPVTDSAGGNSHLFPQDVPLKLGGRRVESAPLCPTDVAMP
eukprot:TRINITY_DN103762_c0_g1_i1.p1 TRINITY_DN103762_c0_g1~~TRINITY_DN103762_c0_g1_i1.p1  ORF type:complete len:1046 (-),score=148.23 TRINITY_DN103762_c0_g1_i1:98-3235(-)